MEMRSAPSWRVQVTGFVERLWGACARERETEESPTILLRKIRGIVVIIGLVDVIDD